MGATEDDLSQLFGWPAVEDVSNDRFLQEMFAGLPDGAWATTAGFRSFDHPNWTAKPWRTPGDWKGSTEANNYVAISAFWPDLTDGEVYRRKGNFARAHAILFDDLIEKIPVDRVLLPFSAVVVTSAASAQGWYFLEDSPAARDPAIVAHAISQLIAKGLSINSTDPGMRGVTRYGRLPVGYNRKPKYPVPFKTRLVSWEPARRYTLERLAEVYGLDLTAPLPQPKRKTEPVTGGDDHFGRIEAAFGALGMVLDRDNGTWFDVECPWREDHSDPTDYSGAALGRPGPGMDSPWGGFRCHHGTCEHRTLVHVEEWLRDRAFDIPSRDPATPGEFELIPMPGEAPDGRRHYRAIARELGMVYNIEQTFILSSVLENYHRALGCAEFCGYQIAFDVFTQRLMIQPWRDARGWRKFTDEDYSRLAVELERGGFRSVSMEKIRDTVRFIGKENEFDSAQVWLKGLEWDGVERVETFLSRYYSAEDSPYTRAVAKYLWSALAGRVLQPGIQADMVVALIGLQGVGKTRGVQALLPDHSLQYVELDLSMNVESLCREMVGRLVGELGELKGMSKRDHDFIKSFISRAHDTWVPKYVEHAVTYPRRCVFIATTNEMRFLNDPTGNRRWCPVRVGSVDLAALARDRLQLWAEARERFLLLDIEWQDSERLAREVHEQHRVIDEWESALRNWFDLEASDGTRNGDQDWLMIEIALEALGITPAKFSRADQMRFATVLRTLGWDNGDAPHYVPRLKKVARTWRKKP